MIFPMLPRAMRQGTLYYQDLQAAVTAQTGRTPGTAPTTNLIADAKTTYNLENDELIDREEVPDGDIAGLGGLDAAQQVAARRGKRAVGNAIEDLTVANVLGNGSVTYTDIGSSFVAAAQLGFDVLADYAGDGPIALVLSSRLFSLVKRYEEVVDRFKFTGVLPAPSRDVRNISRDQLAAALGVDLVLVGNNEQWYTQSATYQDRAALVKLPTDGVDPNEVPQVGRTVWFSATGAVPSGDELFECHTWFSDTELSEMVDVRAYAEQHVLNVEHIYGLDGVDSDLLPS
jgi:hypothetical protein